MSFCFSHQELTGEWVVEHGKRIFKPTGYAYKDRPSCSISAFLTEGGKVRINVRRKRMQYSKYMKKDIEIKFLYSFDISSIQEPVVEKYNQSTCCRNDSNQEFRWAIHLKKEGNEHQGRRDCSIWQWASEGDIRQSEIFLLSKNIERKFKSPDYSMNTDDVDTKGNDKLIMPVMPVTVQPSTDGWKNFVRQVHCAKLNHSRHEVTLVFNDEHLRNHKILESFYRFLRPILYGPITDLESFEVILRENAASHFVFPGIYSGKSAIQEDSVHGDKEWFLRKAPRRRIKYYYSSRMHPIVFMNTANHAMAEEDNNQSLWKWEYVPWEPDSPIVYGDQSRKDIEELVKNLDEKETVDKIVDNLRQQKITEQVLIDPKERKQAVDAIRRKYIVNKSTAERLLDEAIARL
jgi:hypothetical protein